MALRYFKDREGRKWSVWSVSGADATRDGADNLKELMGIERAASAHGWLIFDSGTELRRLATIPNGWYEADDGELERLCRRAVPAADRTRQPH